MKDKYNYKPPMTLLDEQADHFARALIMPITLFKKEYNRLIDEKTGEDEIMIELSKIFKAPLTQVLKRYEELKLDEKNKRLLTF